MGGFFKPTPSRVILLNPPWYFFHNLGRVLTFTSFWRIIKTSNKTNMKAKIKYSTMYRNGKEYPIYIYVEVNPKTKQGKKISKQKYEEAMR